ncbi:prepilin peptidase [Bacillus cereus]
MRVPLGESIITPRSYCHYCKYVLKPKELIPIISFLYAKRALYEL